MIQKTRIKTANLPICRICLYVNVQREVHDPQLLETYEKLASISTSYIRPLVLCCICLAQLNAAHRLRVKCLKAEVIVTDMLKRLHTKEELRIKINRKFLDHLTISSIEQINIDGTVETPGIEPEKPLTLSHENDLEFQKQGSPETAYIDAEPDGNLSTAPTKQDTLVMKITVGTQTEQEEVRADETERDKMKQGSLETAKVDAEPANDHTMSQTKQDSIIKMTNVETQKERKPVRIEWIKRNEMMQATPIARKTKLETKDNKSDKANKIIKKVKAANSEPKLNKNFKKPEIKGNIALNKINSEAVLNNSATVKSLGKERVVNKRNLGYNIGSSRFVGETLEAVVDNNSETSSVLGQDSDTRTTVAPVDTDRETLCSISDKTCKVCKKYFPQKYDLIVHSRLHTRGKLYACNVCGLEFSARSMLKEHKLTQTVENPFVCDVCKKCFGKECDLKIHLLIHTGKKPYGCNVCGKSFGKRSTLVNHLRTHTGEKPYVCDVCDKRFAQNSQYRYHLCRTNTGEKPVVCKVCHISFCSFNNLITHTCLSTVLKPFVCDICKKDFYLEESLARHKLNHAAEKSYDCRVCKKTYKSKDDLNKHSRTHTEQKVYDCDVCGKQYFDCSELIQHKSSVHAAG